jgi:hypothetical protein
MVFSVVGGRCGVMGMIKLRRLERMSLLSESRTTGNDAEASVWTAVWGLEELEAVRIDLASTGELSMM